MGLKDLFKKKAGEQGECEYVGVRRNREVRLHRRESPQGTASVRDADLTILSDFR